MFKVYKTSSVSFASQATYNELLAQGLYDLPPVALWACEQAEQLASKMVVFLGSHLGDTNLWRKFPYVIALIFEDKQFLDVFTSALGAYIGSDSFAEGLMDRAQKGEVMWTEDCVSLIERLQNMHEVRRLQDLDKELDF